MVLIIPNTSNVLLVLTIITTLLCSCRVLKADTAGNQLLDWRSKNPLISRATDLRACPVPSLTASLGVGRRGPLLLRDNNFLEHMAHFDRERIPERVAHAKGAGAFGYFIVTHDISGWTKADLFKTVGKKTPVVARFSTNTGELGSADTVRDSRGFAVKFYTDDGNWDLVGNTFPNFPIRDPLLFPSMTHSRKRNPQTHLKDANMYWDFASLRPETIGNIMFQFADQGIPDGYRHTHGFGIHTFKLVNQKRNFFFVKFHFRTDQGVKNIFSEVAEHLAGKDPDYGIRDLYNAIENGDFPSWTFGIQLMTVEQAKIYRWNPFDITKFWPFEDFPFIPVGKLILNRNPKDFFTEVEEATFNPGNFVPGIEASPDRMLHGRIFSYPDTQRHRVGVNSDQIPVNRPLPHVPVKTYRRDGRMCINNGNGGPNYFPNGFNGPFVDPDASESVDFINADEAIRTDTGDEDNFSQSDYFWRNELGKDERQRLVDNIAAHLSGASDQIRERTLINIFDKVNPEMSKMLRVSLDKALNKH